MDRRNLRRATLQAARGKDPPNPHDVAEAIAMLVAQPTGARPARAVVRKPFGADAVNDANAPVQHSVLEALGLGALATLAV